MPISPKELADKRTENAVTKLCDLIDKKLQESEELPFTFKFLPTTSPDVINAIYQIYRNAGWLLTLENQDGIASLVLDIPSNIGNSITKECEMDSVAVGKPTPKPLSIEEQRNNILNLALQSSEGRVALCNSLVNATDLNLSYQTISRKLFVVDNINPGEKPCVDINTAQQAIYYSSDGTIQPYSSYESEDAATFHASVEIFNEDLRATSNLLDKAQIEIAKDLTSQESEAVVKLLRYAAGVNQTIHTYLQTTDRAILDAIGEIEAYGLVACKLIINPKTYRRVMFGDFSGEYNEATQRDVMMTGLYGHIYTLDVHVSVHVCENEIFISPMAQALGTCVVEEKASIDIEVKDDSYVLNAQTKIYPILANPEYVRKIVVRF